MIEIMTSHDTTAASPRIIHDRKMILRILESNWQTEERGYHTYEKKLWRRGRATRSGAARCVA
jgi:hypothetical protein